MAEQVAMMGKWPASKYTCHGAAIVSEIMISSHVIYAVGQEVLF